MERFGTPTFKVSKGMHGVQYEGVKADCQSNLENVQKYNFCDFVPKHPIEVHDDVKVTFYIPKKRKPLFGYWWHTYFEEGNEIKENFDETTKDCRILTFGYSFIDGIRHGIKKKK